MDADRGRHIGLSFVAHRSMSSAHGKAAGRLFDLPKDSVRFGRRQVCSLTHVEGTGISSVYSRRRGLT